MLDAATRKARLGMSVMGLPLGIASEGTFGPHPAIPFMPAGIELLVFVDEERQVVIAESLVAEATNFDHLIVSPGDALDAFLKQIGFPAHGLIVRPNEGGLIEALVKGVVEKSALNRAIIHCSRADSKLKCNTL